MIKRYKVFVLLIFAFILISVSNICITTVNNPVHASRISKLMARRAKDYRDIKLIDIQLSRITHRHIHEYKLRKSIIKRHYPVGEWYLKNAKRLYDKLSYGESSMFLDGQSDSSGSNGITPSKDHNLTYRRAWIITYANDDNEDNEPSEVNGGDYWSYTRANNIYNRGVARIKADHNGLPVYYNPQNNTWHTRVSSKNNSQNNVLAAIGSTNPN